MKHRAIGYRITGKQQLLSYYYFFFFLLSFGVLVCQISSRLSGEKLKLHKEFVF